MSTKEKNTYKLIHARMLTSMPHMCGYTHTEARIHPQWLNTWMRAPVCVHGTHTHALARARAHTHTHTHTHFEMHTSNVNLSVRREAEWRYIIIQPVCLVFFFEKKKEKKNKFIHKIWHKSVSFFSIFFFFCFTVFSDQPLRSGCMEKTSYPPCNQVYKRSQQNAYTHWSTTACDVIRHPKTMFARWSILPTKLICLMCRFALRQQYAILFSGQKFQSFFTFSFHLSFGFFQASFFFFFWSFIIDGRLPFLLSVNMIHYPESIVHWSLKILQLQAALCFFLTVMLQLGPEFWDRKQI